MIARLGYFEGLTDEQKRAQEDNANRRFKPALLRQPGLLAIYYVQSPNGDRATIGIWENKHAMEQGGVNANAAPLLPGQRGEDIPSPNRVEIWEVLDHYVAPSAARA